MSPAVSSLATSCRLRSQTLLRRARHFHWMRMFGLSLPVTAVLLPAAILFAAISARLPHGYGRLALALLAIAVAVLIAELVLTLPWRSAADAALDAAPDADPAGGETTGPPDPAQPVPAVSEERYRAF